MGEGLGHRRGTSRQMLRSHWARRQLGSREALTRVFLSLADAPQKGSRGDLRRQRPCSGGCRSNPWATKPHLSWSSCQASSTWVHVTLLAGHLAQIASLLVKSSPSHFSTAENRLSSRNFVTMVVTVSPLLRTWTASFPDSRAGQGVQTPPELRGHPSPRKPRLEGEAAHPPPAWAGQCQGGLLVRLLAGGWPGPGWL